MTRSYAYRLIDQGRVIRTLEQVMSPIGDIINEHTARKLKPQLDVIVETIQERIADGADRPGAPQALEGSMGTETEGSRNAL